VNEKMHKDQFNISDTTHIALHYTSFRQLVNKSRMMALLGYRPDYTDYIRVVERWKKGSQKNAEQVKRLHEIADQFKKFIINMGGKDWQLAGPWLTHRIEETFGDEGHPGNQLFVINKTGVWIAPPFMEMDQSIPEELDNISDNESEELVSELPATDMNPSVV
jgi:hypothetical protein